MTSMTRTPLVCVAAALILAAVAHAQSPDVLYINPPGLTKPNGYTHVVVAADGRTVHIAGQIAVDSLGQIVGAGDFKAQVERVYTNLRIALASVGGSLSDLVKTTTYISDRSQLSVLREVRTRYLDPAHPPANTVVVAGLARAELLVEIEGVAVLKRPFRP